jgi:DNA (cytosine-5)-methyltransferase 1
MIKVGSDFSGVGAFNQALKRLNIEYKEVFACDMDKYARQTFIHNYGEPEYYPTNVYDRAIPTEPLDIYMTSPPCQAFSLAGKRLGKDDKRGILFFNSYEFIQTNKPRYFIFENVKGLLSDDGGRTFSEWVNMLGGKSINGNTVLFPYEESVPYHLYWQVLNAKEHGVPQNRERVFLIGIRDDQDNNFRFPVEEQLTKRLKDVLEDNVDDKYFLSEKMINVLAHHNNPIIENETPKNSACIHAGYFKMGGRDQQYLKVTNFQGNDICNTIRTGGKGSLSDKHNWDTIKIKSATSKGYEEAQEGDSINFSVPNSETRRGRVGKQVAQTLDTACNQAVMIGALRGRNPENPSDRTTGAPTEQRLEINENGTSNAITTVQKDNLVVQQNLWIADYRADEGLRIRKDNISPCTTSSMRDSKEWNAKAGTRNPPLVGYDYKIRRLTPRECFRLMDFPDTFSWPVSDSQAYKQAGNSIVVNVLAKIINNLKL